MGNWSITMAAAAIRLFFKKGSTKHFNAFLKRLWHARVFFSTLFLEENSTIKWEKSGINSNGFRKKFHMEKDLRTEMSSNNLKRKIDLSIWRPRNYRIALFLHFWSTVRSLNLFEINLLQCRCCYLSLRHVKYSHVCFEKKKIIFGCISIVL